MSPFAFPGRSRRHGAFTLLELIAVVGVLLVLIALAFPAITKARAMSHATMCVHNL